ncbi:MAG: TolC family protein, partial [Planctomycetota bacterium JB042]
LDLRQAWARLAQADAALRVQESRRWPILVGTGSSDVGAAYVNPEGLPNARTSFSTLAGGVNAAYEIDLFGHVTRSIEAATADAERAARLTDALLIAVRSELALAYIELRALQERESTLLGHIAHQRETVRFMTEERSPRTIEADVALARRSLAESEAALPPLRFLQRGAKSRIAVLAGRLPTDYDELLEPEGAVPVAPDRFAVGLPADVLRRRPDLRAAERRVAAESARIGVEMAELYPRFSLNGALAASAFHTDNGDTTARSAGVGPAFRWNLFNAGRVRSFIDAQDARAEEALLAYEQAVLRAMEQVENGLAVYLGEQEGLAATIRAADEARVAARLFGEEYRTSDVRARALVQGERENRVLDDLEIVARSRVASAYVALCRDLGGGYDPRPLEEAP